MLSIMSGWSDSQWNVGSWINEGYQLKGNSMAYNRYTAGFYGMRGNHDSNWSGELRDFHDMIMYTRRKKAANRFFSVEYFRTGNVSTALAMAAAMARSINNGAWNVGFVYESPADTQEKATIDASNFIREVAGALGNSGHLSRALAEPTAHSVENSFNLKTAWTQSPVSGHNLMVEAFNSYRNQNNGTRQYIGVDYTIPPTAQIGSALRPGVNQLRVVFVEPMNQSYRYEFNFREYTETSWLTWNDSLALSSSNSNPLLYAPPSAGLTSVTFNNAFFEGKTINARVRVWVNNIPSQWSNITTQ